MKSCPSATFWPVAMESLRVSFQRSLGTAVSMDDAVDLATENIASVIEVVLSVHPEMADEIAEPATRVIYHVRTLSAPPA